MTGVTLTFAEIWHFLSPGAACGSAEDVCPGKDHAESYPAFYLLITQYVQVG